MVDRIQRLRLRQLDDSLQAWKAGTAPHGEGWIRTIRTALGMTLAVLARRLGATFQAVSQFEKAEVDGSITLGTLRTIADALECDLVYALVPRESLHAFLEREARRRALRRTTAVQHSMSLETQDVSQEEIENQVQELTEELLAGNWRRIWQET